VTYLKDACDRGRIPSETVRGYRGGYLPRERREIERSCAMARSAPWWPPTRSSWASTSARWTPS
jgi:hypothetical protein